MFRIEIDINHLEIYMMTIPIIAIKINRMPMIIMMAPYGRRRCRYLRPASRARACSAPSNPPGSCRAAASSFRPASVWPSLRSAAPE